MACSGLFPCFPGSCPSPPAAALFAPGLGFPGSWRCRQLPNLPVVHPLNPFVHKGMARAAREAPRGKDAGARLCWGIFPCFLEQPRLVTPPAALRAGAGCPRSLGARSVFLIPAFSSKSCIFAACGASAKCGRAAPLLPPVGFANTQTRRVAAARHVLLIMGRNLR